MSAPGTAVAKVPATKDGMKALVTSMTEQIRAVAGKYITPQSVLALTLDAASKNPDLLQCTRASIVRSLMKVSRLGLVIGEDVHLVPVRDTKKNLVNCEAWADYRGLKKLLKRANIIRDMWERVVYEKELESLVIEYGVDEKLVHKPILRGEKGPMVGAYTRIQLPHGRSTFHYMSLEEIEAIRKGSKQWGPAKVKDCPEWYAMKTVVRDWAARQPLSAELSLALEADDTQDEPERPDGVTEDGEIVDADFEVVDGDAQEPDA